MVCPIYTIPSAILWSDVIKREEDVSVCLWPEPAEAEVPAGEAVPDEGVLVPAQVEVVQAQPSPRQPQQVRHAEALLEVDSVPLASYLTSFWHMKYRMYSVEFD